MIVGEGVLPSRSNAALKEWAIVCQALAAGRQCLLIRKGGILEIKRGFQVEHGDFWLFPTYVHQNVEDLIPEVHAEFSAAQVARPPEGIVQVQLYATVAHVVRVTDLDWLRRLDGLHVLSRECVVSRFNYRNRPGVHVLVLRVYRRPAPLQMQNTPEYDGCVSWVDLEQPLETAGCLPVISDAEFERRRGEILARLNGAGAVVGE